MSEVQAEAVAAAVAETAVAEIDDSPDAVFESVAKEMGWSPKDKWRGDPDKHVDAKTFIRNTPKVLKSAKDQIERSARVAHQALEKARADMIADAEARIEAAVDTGDKDAARAAREDLKRAAQPPDPTIAEFERRNPWMASDDMARSVAIAAAQKVADNQGSVQAQLAGAEKEVRKRFPELFEDDAPIDDEPPARVPPAVQGGQRTAAPAKRRPGWTDLPSHVRSAWTPKRIKDFGMSEAEIATAYFEENA